jgi:Holliday junction resolvase RusA-like endonuclease
MEDEDPMVKPVRVSIEARFVPATSWPKWKQAAACQGLICHTSKPDVDNLAKAALDAINGVVFVDDQQVFEVTVRKTYGPSPVVEITVDEVWNPEKKDDLPG